MEPAESENRVAELVLQLKRQFQAVVVALPDYGSDVRIVREIDGLGDLIKQLEDTVVITRVQSAGES